MYKILILDANQRSALAATRSLGRKGISVATADVIESTLAGSSRYCNERFAYPSPYEDPEDFLAILRQEAFARDVKVLFPMTELSTGLLLRNRSQFADIKIPGPSFETFDCLTDKYRLFELARKLHVPIPTTYFIETMDELPKVYKELKFPVVLKPRRSIIFIDGKWRPTSVKYARSAEEIERTVQKDACFHSNSFLIQQYIRGEGQGIFALYDSGHLRTFFGHKRLREKPPSGGVSVLSESIELNPQMCEIARTILDNVKYHGVAMVEFKVSADGAPYLMEVNARFWGSLQLAVDAGVDFPYLLYSLVLGHKVESITSYKTGVRSRWLLGDLDHLYLRLKDKNLCDQRLPPLSHALFQFLWFFDKNTRYDVIRWHDFQPFFFELKTYLRQATRWKS